MKRIVTALVLSCGAVVAGCGSPESPELVANIQEELPVAVLWKCTAECSRPPNCECAANKKLKLKWIDCAKSHGAGANFCDPQAQADADKLCASTYGGGSKSTKVQCSLVKPLTQCVLPPGGGSGDPHMVTFDGVRYEGQYAGEFILATDRSTYSVQVRTQRWGQTQTTVQTAAAVQMGDTKVSIYANESPALRINDAPAVIQCPGQPIYAGKLCSGRVNFDNGAWLTYDAAQSKFSVYLPDEVSHLDVYTRGGYMNTEFFPSPAIAPFTSGIIGTPNKTTADDFTLRNGRVLAQPISFSDMYNVFANSWRVSESESAFTYPTGLTTWNYTDVTFPRMQMVSTALSQAQRDAATATCKAAGVAAARMEECIIDAAFLGEQAVLDFVRIGPAY